MRRHAFTIALSALCLSSCIQPGDLPAEQVLLRSSVANRGLTSARFSVRTAATDERGLNAEANVDGVMQQGGRQLSMNIGTTGQSAAGMSWNASGKVVVLSENEIYLNIHELGTTPLHPLLSSPGFAGLQDKWLRLPGGNAAVPTEPLTPDPAFLRMQSDIIRVVRDRGIVTLDGRSAYRYDVEIDPIKLSSFLSSQQSSGSVMALPDLSALQSATGEIWIDEETFLLTRANWHISTLYEGEPIDVSLSMQLSDIGTKTAILAPSPVEPLPGIPLLPPPEATFMLQL